MDNRASIKDKYKNKEKKGQTEHVQSKTQIEHPPVMNNKHTKDKIQNNINNDNKNLSQNNPQQKNNHINQEKIDISQKKEYIPYSCIPQLEKNDCSFSIIKVQG